MSAISFRLRTGFRLIPGGKDSARSTFVCDLVFVFAGVRRSWSTVAPYTMAGGIVGALAAAIPRFIDLLSLPPETRKTALLRMGINLAIVVLYVINFRVLPPAV
jgi:uncharacterized membrane protein